MKKKICVITSSRADYNPLKTLLSLLKKDTNFILQLVTTGAHLTKEFGATAEIIEKDGFCINESVECILSSDTYQGMAKSIGLAVIGFTDAFQRLKPDCVVVLGDRFEIFAAAQAAYCLKIPIAHIHGGELTEGAHDDGFRHAVTKLSHLHFVSHEGYRKRVIQMGESPENVHVCGAPGLDLMESVPSLTKEELGNFLGFPLKEYFLITYHPSAFDEVPTKQGISTLLSALEKFSDKQLLITAANVDPEGRLINQILQDYEKQYPDRVKLVKNLSEKYFSAVKHCVAVIGNSSSGIIEVPYFRKATINLGERQRGRECSSSVLHSKITSDAIHHALNLAMNKEWVQENLLKEETIYGIPGRISKKIVEHLSGTNLDVYMRKRFYEI